MSSRQMLTKTILGCAMGCVIAVLFAGIYSKLSRADRFDRKHWEAVVAQARFSGLKPGERREFVLDMRSEPYQIRDAPADHRWPQKTGEGYVWAEASTDEKLKVVIQTRALGHRGGRYGFAYSDTPLTPKPLSDGGWFSIDVPSDLNFVQPNMKIDEHWWEVVNNLD